MSLRADIATRKIKGAELPMAGDSVKGAKYISGGETKKVNPNDKVLAMIEKDVMAALKIAEKSNGEKAFAAALKKSTTR